MENKRFDVTAFGESMLRLSVPAGTRLANMRALDVHFAGAESNVLAALACLGRCCGWSGAVPTGEIGRFAARALASAGITAAPIAVPNSRLGTYYVEFAAPPRATQVIYDRANSAITRLTVDQMAFDFLLDTRILHLTGITPPLAPSCLAIVRELIERAKAANVAISFDVNFRSKLWSADEAAASLLPLLQGVDLLFCGQRDASALFGCDGSAESVIRQLAELTAAKQIVVTTGDAGVTGWDGAAIYHQPAQPVKIIDRIGAGDALAAGVLHGWLHGELALGLRYGTMMAALVLSQHGDMLVSSLEEVDALLALSQTQAAARLVNR